MRVQMHELSLNENLMNTRLSNATGNSSNRIVVNLAINVFYRPTFRMHLTNKEILDKLLNYSEDLKHHYHLYQLLLFHFQDKKPDKFFGLIEDNIKQVHPLFQTVFKTFLKDKEKNCQCPSTTLFKRQIRSDQ